MSLPIAWARLTPRLRRLGHDDARSAAQPAQRRVGEPHRSRADDEHGLTDADADALLTMDRAGQRLDERSVLKRHRVGQLVDIGRGSHDIFGHAPRVMYAELTNLGAEQLLMMAAKPAGSAGNVDVGRHLVARLNGFDA